MRPSRGLPPVELWRGVKPRKAANSRPLAKSPMSWIVAIIAEAVTGPTPGMVINRLAVSLALTAIAISLSIAVGNHSLAVFVKAVDGQPLQIIGMLRALRRVDADLGQMPAQRVERRRPLAGEQLAGPMAHQLGLVLDRPHRHEPLTRPPRCLANRRGIDRVVLVAPDVGLHMRGRDQPHFEADASNCPPNDAPTGTLPSPPHTGARRKSL